MKIFHKKNYNFENNNHSANNKENHQNEDIKNIKIEGDETEEKVDINEKKPENQNINIIISEKVSEKEINILENNIRK